MTIEEFTNEINNTIEPLDTMHRFLFLIDLFNNINKIIFDTGQSVICKIKANEAAAIISKYDKLSKDRRNNEITL